MTEEVKAYQIDLISDNRIQIAQGVTYVQREYRLNETEPLKAFFVIVSPDSPAKLSVAAAPQGKTKTVPEHFRDSLCAGKQVIAAINSGYFHLAAGTLTSYGMQIIDGQVIKEPNGGAERYGDNWIGRTYDGQYVIGSTDDYVREYRGKLVYGCGGGDILLLDGENRIIDVTSVHPRSGIAITKEGGLVFGCIDGRSEESVGVSLPDHLRIYSELGFEITDMLNLDGGGSSQLVVKCGDKEPLIMNKPALDPEGLRPVADVLLLVLPSEQSE
ncbi:MAG: phosphodiester glycosidase family protein [Clostridia bacterium]|nr:phosphodiester glycosidase family protein [Clostridia bacterium]